MSQEAAEVAKRSLPTLAARGPSDTQWMRVYLADNESSTAYPLSAVDADLRKTLARADATMQSAIIESKNGCVCQHIEPFSRGDSVPAGVWQFLRWTDDDDSDDEDAKNGEGKEKCICTAEKVMDRPMFGVAYCMLTKGDAKQERVPVLVRVYTHLQLRWVSVETDKDGTDRVKSQVCVDAMKEEFDFFVGKGQVPRGLEYVIVRCRPGDKLLIRMTPPFGWARRYAPPGLPPKCSLEAYVHVLRFEKETTLPKMTAEERWAYVLAKKDSGGKLFHNKSYHSALREYNKAIHTLRSMYPKGRLPGLTGMVASLESTNPSVSSISAISQVGRAPTLGNEGVEKTGMGVHGESKTGMESISQRFMATSHAITADELDEQTRADMRVCSYVLRINLCLCTLRCGLFNDCIREANMLLGSSTCESVEGKSLNHRSTGCLVKALLCRCQAYTQKGDYVRALKDLTWLQHAIDAEIAFRETCSGKDKTNEPKSSSDAGFGESKLYIEGHSDEALGQLKKRVHVMLVSTRQKEKDIYRKQSNAFGGFLRSKNAEQVYENASDATENEKPTRDSKNHTSDLDGEEKSKVSRRTKPRKQTFSLYDDKPSVDLEAVKKRTQNPPGNVCVRMVQWLRSLLW